MDSEEQKEDAVQLIGIQLSTHDLIDLICSSVQVMDIDVESKQEIVCNLPVEIGELIVGYLRIQDRQTVKVGDEVWVRMDTKKFRSIAGYLQASYPWATKGRKLDKDIDAYCEGVELWERYRVKYNLITDFGSVLRDDQLKCLRMIVKALPNRAKKHASSDLITLYSTYNLFNSFGVATRDIIGAAPITQNEFINHW
eukprot:CAMPEP_0202688420 /NCGR_PEP_ID=MMETSP1385-20130828/3942_1 /ASSEMBLY_ACC=CAM_ASM_000861 /TAXON_ID=933848 /ORGANISM="Elphidium margaritaceum" /LENGTH=196 /DNA_ID=CAMNT_0049343397 /DNA_START=18 /DNA_END=605 /DNA_ORIENTATION=+